MKGLFVKDIELMKQQKQFFILVVVMGVILNLAGSGSVSFAIGYFTIVTAIFAGSIYVTGFKRMNISFSVCIYKLCANGTNLLSYQCTKDL